MSRPKIRISYYLIRRSTLLTIYKTFVRPHLDDGDIIYLQLSFHHNIGSAQYNAFLAITGVIRGTSKEKLNDVLGLETRQLRHWVQKVMLLLQI